jgi:DNA-binding Lrp family transcriptional regulator
MDKKTKKLIEELQKEQRRNQEEQAQRAETLAAEMIARNLPIVDAGQTK